MFNRPSLAWIFILKFKNRKKGDAKKSQLEQNMQEEIRKFCLN